MNNANTRYGIRLQNRLERSYFRRIRYMIPNAASRKASTSRDASNRPAGKCLYVSSTSTATMTSSPSHTITYAFMPGSRVALVAMACPFPPELWSARVHQIREREHEHPHHVHKLPIEAGRLDVGGVEAAAAVAERDHREGDDARDHVQQAEAGDAEEGGAEQHGAAEGVLEQPPPLADHPGPFPQVQRGEHHPE